MSYRNALFAAMVVLLSGGAMLPAQVRGTLEEQRKALVEEAIAGEGIQNPAVLKAMSTTPRHEFVPLPYRHLAYVDMSLPIGSGQTISPPYVVAYMTEQLDPQPDDRVLEIGTGSGYQAAVLSPIVKEVYSIEIVEELGRRAAATLRRLKYTNVYTKVGDGYLGWPEHAPFDKIIVTCSPEKVPQPLIDQLKEGGRMIIPVGERYQQSLYLYTKREGKIVAESLQPTLFVPMTGQAEAQREIKPDPLNPKLVNGDFETIHEKSRKPTGWHYQRQLTIGADNAPQGKYYAVFSNAEGGRWSQCLQAFPVEGGKLREIMVGCTIRGKDIRPSSAGDSAGLVITFYDESRKIIGETAVGTWKGTFAWRTENTKVRIPNTAREAIIRVGLLGATGELAVDDVSVRKLP